MSWDWISRVKELSDLSTPVVMVSVCQVAGSAPREVGAKMLVFADGAFEGTIGGGQLELLAIADAVTVLAQARSKHQRYPLAARAGQCCGGYVDLLFEVLNAGPRLHVFGAGHVGQAVADVLVGTAFQVHLIDERAEWAKRRAAGGGVYSHHMTAQQYFETQRLGADAYCLVMTHSHQMDQEIVASLLSAPACRYVGLIGSKSKWQRFRQRLKLEGFVEAQLDTVRCPIGLPLGGKAPKEIAISVAAELLQLHTEHMQQVAAMPGEIDVDVAAISPT